MALRQIELMESYLQRFLRLGAGRDEAVRPRDLRDIALAEFVDEVLSLVRPRGRHVGVEIQWTAPASPILVHGDRQELQELLVNLLLNGIEAATAHQSESAAAWVRVEVWAAPPNRVTLRVLDSGPGPSDLIATQLFEPFVTDKPEGTGLGLAVAKQIAESHGGTLRWSRESGATCFEVDLPRSS
jgi:C4-dicarboxylate-specific signal transduction histidine kinase